MRFTVVTLFPEMFESVLGASMLGRAIEGGLLQVDFVNPRDFAEGRHKSVDDAPYGGGPGMVMKCRELMAALDSLKDEGKDEKGPHRILMSPVGGSLDHVKVRELAGQEHIALVCGRYEGIDERVVELGIDESLSIGDYVLTGGELGAMVLIDAVARFIPGVLGDAESAEEESFASGLLEYPQYTRPAEFRGLGVPEILSSGHHAKIQEWRHQRSLERTAEHRPELLRAQPELVKELAARTHVILAHHPVLDRNGKVVTTSVTNFDIHDIARSAATYGLAGYYPVSPVRLQREKIERIIKVWKKDITQANAHNREQALGTIRVSASIEEAVEHIEKRAKAKPFVVATSAQRSELAPAVGYTELFAQRVADPGRPLVLILGTGWGLDESVIASSDQLLLPVYGPGDFNHLCVRSALAIMLDRLFGRDSQATYD